MLFTLAWIGWLLAFVVIEAVALVEDKHHVGHHGGRTLSAHLRHWFRTDTHVGRTVWLAVSALFLVGWFIPHIAADGFVWPW